MDILKRLNPFTQHINIIDTAFSDWKNVAAVEDTTPCMDEMLRQEECVVHTQAPTELLVPSWPTLYPVYANNLPTPQGTLYEHLATMDNKSRSLLKQCEPERFTYKCCLRKVVSETLV